MNSIPTSISADPMTPVRALLDTVHDDPRVYGDPVLTAARAATASISQLLSEHDKVVALIADMKDSAEQLRKNGEVPAYQCRLYDAERLESILGVTK